MLVHQRVLHIITCLILFLLELYYLFNCDSGIHMNTPTKSHPGDFLHTSTPEFKNNDAKQRLRRQGLRALQWAMIAVA